MPKIAPAHELGFHKLTCNGQSLYRLSIPALWVRCKVRPIDKEYWVDVIISEDGNSLIIKGPSEFQLGLITSQEGTDHD